ncbi:MAG: hypothetical protein ACE5KU_05165 [Nitrososphaerales archaeon]
MVKTMKISDDTHRELTIISAQLTAQDGQRRTFDETIMDIIEAYRSEERATSRSARA